MDPEIKSMHPGKWLRSFLVEGKALSKYVIVSSGFLWDVLTTFLIVITITISLLVGQLYY